MSSISRRQPQTDVTPYLGHHSGMSLAVYWETEPASRHDPDAVRISLCRLPARASSAADGSRSLTVRKCLISSLLRRLSIAEEVTATATTTAANVETTDATAVVADVDLASSQ